MKATYLTLLLTIMLISSACKDDSPATYSSIEGIWRCEESSATTGNRAYLVDIYRKSTDTTQYVITNFYNTGDMEYIVVKLKSGKLSLSQQPTADISIKAFAGTLTGNNYKNIGFSYTVYDGTRDINFTANYSRK